jgi:hypothetical protein
MIFVLDFKRSVPINKSETINANEMMLSKIVRSRSILTDVDKDESTIN